MLLCDLIYYRGNSLQVTLFKMGMRNMWASCLPYLSTFAGAMQIRCVDLNQFALSTIQYFMSYIDKFWVGGTICVLRNWHLTSSFYGSQGKGHVCVCFRKWVFSLQIYHSRDATPGRYQLYLDPPALNGDLMGTVDISLGRPYVYTVYRK